MTRRRSHAERTLDQPMYPDDENGQVLRDMAAAGVDLTLPRKIDFQHCFTDEASARAFREAVLPEVDGAEVYETEEDGETGWEVECHVRMTPTHAEVGQTVDASELT